MGDCILIQMCGLPEYAGSRDKLYSHPSSLVKVVIISSNNDRSYGRVDSVKVNPGQICTVHQITAHPSLAAGMGLMYRLRRTVKVKCRWGE